MPRIYLDQDALIRLGRRNPDADTAEVRRRIEARDLLLVLSPAHWLDTAGGDSDDNCRQLARFIDDLRPNWLRERLSLIRFEIRNFLLGVPFESTRDQAVFNTVTETVAEISGLVGGGAAIVGTEAIVMEIRHNPRAREIFANTYATAERNAEKNRRAFRQGRITPEFDRRVQELAFQRFGNIAAGSEEEQRLRGRIQMPSAL